MSTLTLASIDVRYSHHAASELARLLNMAPSTTEATPQGHSLNLQAVVLQSLRDGGGAMAQAATVASNSMSPFSVESGPVSVMIPASAPRKGAHPLRQSDFAYSVVLSPTVGACII
jgi:hypothetical protein